MARLTVQYVCTECSAASAKWLGRCPACGRWHTLQEEWTAAPATAYQRGDASRLMPRALRLEELAVEEAKRLPSGLAEFDRVLGGGLVPGALVLLCGDPGIGKSTLMLQACRGLVSQGSKVLYVSGEESAPQVALRARRLGGMTGDFFLLSDTRWENMYAHLERERPHVLAVDSIQTLSSQDLPASAGSVTQIREVTARLLEEAKSRDMACLLVGHVTKEGGLAGPRTLEHMVDAVLSFEGEKHQPVRMLRAVKNRFGGTEEMGLFEMCAEGLRGLEAASEYFLRSRQQGLPGSVALVALEGSRPMLAEVQALVAPTHWGTPQRSSTGLDPWRMGLIYAVLEKRCGVQIHNQDIFVSVAGGLRLDEPAVDLAAACAVVSSLRGRPLAEGWIAFGEVGLGGELRPCRNSEARLREAARLGFQAALLPGGDEEALRRWSGFGMELRPVSTLEQALAEMDRG